jgi:hypothetical protein
MELEFAETGGGAARFQSLPRQAENTAWFGLLFRVKSVCLPLRHASGLRIVLMSSAAGRNHRPNGRQTADMISSLRAKSRGW